MNKALFLPACLAFSLQVMAADPIPTNPAGTPTATLSSAISRDKGAAVAVPVLSDQTVPEPGAATVAQPQTEQPQAKADTAHGEAQNDMSADAQIVAIQDEPPVDLWQRIRSGLSLPELDSDTVRKYERLYTSHPAYMSATLDRARLYLFHVVEEVDKRHMPMEIALLPIVESSYNPEAQSPSAASGIWQFLPSTGKVFGLKQNNWYDGRRDILTATQAALDYLERLQAMFGDWQLALAAYNCGEGCVARAVAQNRSRGLPTDLSSLNLPEQTRNYVPKLIAVRNIIRAPEQYGLSLEDIPNQPAFKRVTLHYPIEASTAAKLAAMDLDDFLALNPGFRRRVIYAESQNTLLLPPDKVDVFRNNLAETEAHDIRLHTFQAPKGALLSRIADHFNVTVKWLNDHNPLAAKRGKLVTAQTLVLPPAARKIADAAPAQLVQVSSSSTKTAASAKVTKHASVPARKHLAKRERVRIHTVRKGDTLYDLAKHYKVDVAEIVELNGHHRTLRPGERIQIPSSS